MRRAVERGLAVADFENMTLGQVLDYLIFCQNEDAGDDEKIKPGVRKATAADVAAW